ncbi:tripartite tricarboxylate transporter TctB family protein [Devosia naphthalenivorans]|uniref:tripartite tricarboxylate transporter TctB family protein n=1 Tax=Devosia naphthalenivorans TaxID=2082392 RepID=UPI000D3B36B4|nr:tripartite tricarboxylate transporter TctB family protein [Devosia naphthalenivorans]
MNNTSLASKLTNGRIAAAIFAVVSALFCIEGASYPYMTSIGPGAGFFPVWVGGLGAVLGLLLLVFPSQPEATEDLAEEVGKPARPTNAAMMIAVTVGCLLAAAALLPSLGFLLVTSLLTTALLWLYERRPAVALVGGIFSGPAIYYLFSLLQVRLPTGVFGI